MATTRRELNRALNKERAAELVAQGMTLTQALRNLGYEGQDLKRTTKRVEESDAYQRHLARLQEENRQMLRMKREDVQEIVMEAIQMARLGADPMAMLRGAQELNKMCGFYAPEEHKIDLNVSQRRIIEQFDTMSDTELALLASKTQVIDIQDAEIVGLEDHRGL